MYIYLQRHAVLLRNIRTVGEVAGRQSSVPQSGGVAEYRGGVTQNVARRTFNCYLKSWDMRLNFQRIPFMESAVIADEQFLTKISAEKSYETFLHTATPISQHPHRVSLIVRATKYSNNAKAIKQRNFVTLFYRSGFIIYGWWVQLSYNLWIFVSTFEDKI